MSLNGDTLSPIGDMKNNKTKKELLASPYREDDGASGRRYKTILLVPSGLKHDSGYMKIAIIGAYNEGDETKYEICGYPDDINWIIPPAIKGRDYYIPNLRTDCFYPSGVMQFWHRNYEFLVGGEYSSTEITVLDNTSSTNSK